MFKFNEIQKIQIEITNRCQASCPMCLRNIHGGIENPLLQLNDWSIGNFKAILNSKILAQIKQVDFCGDFGDPILNNDLIEMCRYLKNNSTVGVVIHTNGSARNSKWWEELAQALPTNHKVEFALDGMSTTHGLHRIGTDFNAIIKNAVSFMLAGGQAHWMFIKFKHNQHEVEDARKYAESLGFKTFNVKTSKRFGKPFPVLNRSGSVIYHIEQYDASDIKPVEFVNLKDYKTWKGEVSCFTYDEKELYIDAHGHLFPCCLIASFLYANYDVALHSKYGLVDNTSVISVAKELQDEVRELIIELGGLDALDTNIHGIEHIMNQPIWQELMHKKWADKTSGPCMVLCSNNSPYITIKEQVSRA